MIGDESVDKGLPTDHWETIIETIRATFPRGTAVIWASDWVCSEPNCTNGGKPCSCIERIPAALDWISSAIYRTNSSSGFIGSVVRASYENHIFPKLASHQKVAVIPQVVVNDGPCDDACMARIELQDAKDSVAWARNDSRVALIAPYLWRSQGCDGHGCDLGLKEVRGAGTDDLRTYWEDFGRSTKHEAEPRQTQRTKTDDAIVRIGESITPPVNATLCEAESCLVSPTNCSSRAECQGCGALCFGSDPADAGWDLYLNSTGLSLQTGASNVWAGILAGGNASHPAPLDGLLRTADIVLSWNSVQPKPPPAAYDWGDLPDALERAYANGGRLMMLLWAGTVRTPSWVYDLGVEMVANSSGGAVPNYLSPKYQDLVRTVHKDLAAFLRSKAPANKAFMALQPCLGATGDDTPFHPGSYTVLDKALESRIRAAWPEYYCRCSCTTMRLPLKSQPTRWCCSSTGRTPSRIGG